MRTNVSLFIRAFHDELSSGEIEESLSFVPHPISGSSKVPPNMGVRAGKSSFCCYELQRLPNENVNSTLARLVEQLWPHRTSLNEFVRMAGKLELYVSVQAGRIWGDMVGSDTLLGLGRLGFDLEIDIMLDEDHFDG